MTIKDTLNKGIIKLKENNVMEPIIKARILLSYLLKKDKGYLITHDKEIVSKEVVKAFLENIELLIIGTPIQYITKKQEFMKLNFYVDSHVLIPRCDTEILVEEVLSISKKYKKNIDILDLCTGSGVIAITLAKNIEKSIIVGTDISKASIKVAIKNAKSHKVEEKIEFFESDIYENISSTRFDIIVSNPPYIESEEIKNLSKEVQNEPIIALDGGEGGLTYYKRIIKGAAKYLKKDGFLCLEIGYNQKEAVSNLLKIKGFTNITCKKDLYGKDRVIIAKP